MPSKRFIYRYRGKGAAPLGLAQKLIESGGLVMLDTSSRMVLVEGEDSQQADLQSKLSDWSASEEKSYTAPKPVIPVLRHQVGKLK